MSRRYRPQGVPGKASAFKQRSKLLEADGFCHRVCAQLPLHLSLRKLLQRRSLLLFYADQPIDPGHLRVEEPHNLLLLGAGRDGDKVVFEFHIVDILPLPYPGDAKFEQLYEQRRFGKIFEIPRYDNFIGNHHRICGADNSLVIRVLNPALKEGR